jgi:hypothetical protein
MKTQKYIRAATIPDGAGLQFNIEIAVRFAIA